VHNAPTPSQPGHFYGFNFHHRVDGLLNFAQVARRSFRLENKLIPLPIRVRPVRLFDVYLDELSIARRLAQKKLMDGEE